MNNFAFATAITNDTFITGIILNKRIMDYYNCKYPFVVICGNEVSEDGKQLLQKYNIIIKEDSSFILKGQYKRADNLKKITYDNTLLKPQLPPCRLYTAFFLSTFNLTEYDYIMAFEADIIMCDDINTKINNFYNINSNFYCYTSINQEESIFPILNSEILFFKPSKENYKQILMTANNSGVNNDHDIINILFYHNYKHINKSDNNLFINHIHMRGNPKLLYVLQQYYPSIIDKIIFCSDKEFKRIYPRILDDVEKIYEINGEFAELMIKVHDLFNRFA